MFNDSVTHFSINFPLSVCNHSKILNSITKFPPEDQIIDLSTLPSLPRRHLPSGPPCQNNMQSISSTQNPPLSSSACLIYGKRFLVYFNGGHKILAPDIKLPSNRTFHASAIRPAGLFLRPPGDDTVNSDPGTVPNGLSIFDSL